MAEQSFWRYCAKCHGLFFDGYPAKGSCAAGGAHAAAGYTFVLPHDVPEIPTAQAAWRYCGKCHGLFYDGYPEKGTCPAGNGHAAAGYTFVLPHDVVGTATNQGAWRYCSKCHGLFYDGYPEKGTCPAGGGHAAIGYNFFLPYTPAITLTAAGNIVTIAGVGFTPASQVTIFYGYDAPPDESGTRSHFTNGADAPLLATTDANGSFTGVTFKLSITHPINIQVEATDTRKHQKADAMLSAV